MLFIILHIQSMLIWNIEDSPNTEDCLREARQKRFDFGGKNYHHEQCESIPDVIDHQMHYVHLDPCYKTLTK